MRAFLHANILFSGAKSDGAIRRLIALAVEAGWDCWIDPFVLEESRRNIGLKCPIYLDDLERIVGNLHIADNASLIDLPDEAEGLAEKDRPVLSAAIQCNCAVLVTGDHAHFGFLMGKTVGGVAIHSARSFAELVLRDGPKRSSPE